jgi:hypothetical protein
MAGASEYSSAVFEITTMLNHSTTATASILSQLTC